LAPPSASNQLNMLQLEFVARAIPNLPAEVVGAYRNIWQGRAIPSCAAAEPHKEVRQQSRSETE
ncbi:MAG: hypothetical protein WA740_09855, partial [Candidatus Binataceae bacterium]